MRQLFCSARSKHLVLADLLYRFLRRLLFSALQFCRTGNTLQYTTSRALQNQLAENGEVMIDNGLLGVMKNTDRK